MTLGGLGLVSVKRALPPFWAVARLVTRMSGSVQSRLFCSMQKRELTVRGIGEFGDLDHP
jgi:hypothetical protein